MRRLRAAHLFLVVLAVFFTEIHPVQGQSKNRAFNIQLTVDPHSILTGPVIDSINAGTETNRFGFEGGRVLKVDGVYHLFTSEMYAPPMWESMRLAHWTSPDAIHWMRSSTLYETLPGATGPRHALWSPLPVFDTGNNRWNLFYVAYAPPGNTEGAIWRAVSQQHGKSGISGPYQDRGIVMQRSRQSQWWEGSQGDDSFFPFQLADGKWLAFYGSHENSGGQHWYAGLAESSSLAGPWHRLNEGNPLKIEPVFIENPIVTKYKNLFLAVYDCDVTGVTSGYHGDAHSIGFTWSRDGIHWAAGQHVEVQPTGRSNWSSDIRTPLGLMPEGNGRFTLLYTGKMKGRDYFAVGMVRVKISIQKAEDKYR